MDHPAGGAVPPLAQDCMVRGQARLARYGGKALVHAYYKQFWDDSTSTLKEQTDGPAAWCIAVRDCS